MTAYAGRTHRFLFEIPPTLLLGLLLLLTGCAPTAEVRDEWADKVTSGTYGWINFNTGEVKNPDPYPPSRIDYLRGNLYPEYSQQCLQQLRSLTGAVTVEIHFLLTEQGHPGQFITMSDTPATCNRDIIDALRTLSFQPGVRDGEPVASVGEFALRLTPGGGFKIDQ
ncbi:MAG: hypothetical protein U5K31_09895 [Balneolaceae bacterium]|nr:hypothetical protein [Balneolaceae bacterium]